MSTVSWWKFSHFLYLITLHMCKLYTALEMWNIKERCEIWELLDTEDKYTHKNFVDWTSENQTVSSFEL